MRRQHTPPTNSHYSNGRVKGPPALPPYKMPFIRCFPPPIPPPAKQAPDQAPHPSVLGRGNPICNPAAGVLRECGQRLTSSSRTSPLPSPPGRGKPPSPPDLACHRRRRDSGRKFPSPLFVFCPAKLQSSGGQAFSPARGLLLPTLFRQRSARGPILPKLQRARQMPLRQRRHAPSRTLPRKLPAPPANNAAASPTCSSQQCFATEDGRREGGGEREKRPRKRARRGTGGQSRSAAELGGGPGQAARRPLIGRNGSPGRLFSPPPTLLQLENPRPARPPPPRPPRVADF